MTQQQSAPPLFRTSHPETSKLAAESMRDSASTLRAKVFAFITGQGEAGATDEQIQLALDMNPSTERPRRVELVRAGSVRDSGDRRKTASGRAAIVWEVSP